jgi:Protein of unknown function (DUF3667)
VSHSKIRTEKICLNCGTETNGRYCPACGQENIEPKQTVWHLLNHFFSDLTHFDGKFFITVKDLFAKPGFLSSEYMAGRRVRYLDPIRMYIFTSAFFFLIFFSFVNVQKIPLGDEAKTEIQKDPDLRELISKAKSARDSLEILRNYNNGANPFVKINVDSSSKTQGHTNLMYHTIESYDSSQKALPAEQRDGWLKRRISTRIIVIEQRLEKEQGVFFRELLSNFIHSFPKMLFISLPIFALLLKLLYVRRKQFYYVDHGIFAVHLYIFSFLLLLVYFGIVELRSNTKWHWLNLLFIPICIYPFFYYYKAMRRFYGQGRGKTILKYLLLFMLSSIVMLLIFICGAVFTFIET